MNDLNQRERRRGEQRAAADPRQEQQDHNRESAAYRRPECSQGSDKANREDTQGMSAIRHAERNASEPQRPIDKGNDHDREAGT